MQKRKTPDQCTPRKIISGKHKGKAILVEDYITQMGGYDGAQTLMEFAARGNWAARNAITLDGYSESDGPFIYGKIKNEDGISLGYIIAEKDLEKC